MNSNFVYFHRTFKMDNDADPVADPDGIIVEGLNLLFASKRVR